MSVKTIADRVKACGLPVGYEIHAPERELLSPSPVLWLPGYLATPDHYRDLSKKTAERTGSISIIFGHPDIAGLWHVANGPKQRAINCWKVIKAAREKVSDINSAPVTLVGHSFGGANAVHLGYEKTEEVAKVVTVNSAGMIEGDSFPAVVRRMAIELGSYALDARFWKPSSIKAGLKSARMAAISPPKVIADSYAAGDMDVREELQRLSDKADIDVRVAQAFDDKGFPHAKVEGSFPEEFYSSVNHFIGNKKSGHLDIVLGGKAADDLVDLIAA